MQSMFDERQWLAWLVKVRIIILTFLLGLELAIVQLTPVSFPLRFFVTVMLFWFTISIFYLLLLSFWREYRIQSLLQVLTDMVLVSLVIYATGGVDSSFNFLYPLVIIVACILLPRVWAYLTAALAFILYGTVLELTYFEVIPSYSTTHPELKALQAIILVNLFGYLAVSYLAGLLATKLRQVDVKLKDTRKIARLLAATAHRRAHPSSFPGSAAARGFRTGARRGPLPHAKRLPQNLPSAGLRTGGARTRQLRLCLYL
jgi:hypothetical protein